MLEATFFQQVKLSFFSLISFYFSQQQKKEKQFIKNYKLFFNRHGIDLDNPGPNSSTSLINSCSPGEAMPSSAQLSDSGDSTGNRSADNATPPMHFLTPHVEISIPYTEQNEQRNTSPVQLNGDGPNSPQSADSNSNAPSSSHHQLPINSTTIHRYTLMIIINLN